MKRLILKQKEEGKEEAYSTSLNFILDNLPLDKFKLDEEAVKQVELLSKTSKLYIRAKDVTLRAKNNLEIVEYTMSQKIRKNLTKYDLKKDSDTTVYKAVKTTSEYKRAFSTYLFTKNKEEEYGLLLDNVRQRGYSIKILVELWLNNYYVDSTQHITKRKKTMLSNG